MFLPTESMSVMTRLFEPSKLDCKVGGRTVITVEPLTAPCVALMVEVPAFTAVARPVVLMVATDVVPEVQVTVLVRFWVELSEKVPVAVNCCVRPLGTLGLAGVTMIDCKIGAVTVMTVEPLMAPCVALMVEVPVFTAVARDRERVV